jgi:hypothetical protein
MMKRIFSCFFLVLSLMMVNAQQDEVNSFQQSENQATGNASGANGSIGDNQVQSGPGNPNGSDEVPIDDYLPALVIIGATLIIYQLKSKKIKTL